MAWDEKAVTQDVTRLIEGGAVDLVPACPAIIPALPAILTPPSGSEYLLPEIIEKVLREAVKDSSQAHLRAARMCLGWTDESYEDLWKLAIASTEIDISENEHVNANRPEAEIMRARDRLLRLRQLRYILAARELSAGPGTRTSFVTKHRQPTIAKLTRAIHEVLRDTTTVERIAEQCGLRVGDVPPSSASSHQAGAPSMVESGPNDPGVAPPLVVTGPPIRIIEPLGGAEVERWIRVRGSGHIPPDRHLWVFVYNQQDLYWPWGKPRILPDLDQWQVGRVMLGEEYPEDLAPYTICAVLANDKADAKIQANWDRPGGAQGTSKLPRGAEVVDRVTVTRVE